MSRSRRAKRARRAVRDKPGSTNLDLTKVEGRLFIAHEDGVFHDVAEMRCMRGRYYRLTCFTRENSR